MQLDNSFSNYKFACNASGGYCAPGIERSGVLTTSTAVSHQRRTDNSLFLADLQISAPSTDVRIMPNIVAIGSLKQGLLNMPFSEHALPNTISTHSLNVIGVMAGLIGTTINSAVSVRKATPIFKDATVEKFAGLVKEWQSTRNPVDSGIDMFTNAAYQKIIGMGHEVVPLILKELEVNVDYWFWALKAITGKDPVLPAHRGRLRLMSKDWLGWAKKQGYQW